MSDISMPGVGSGIDWSMIVEYEVQTYRRYHVQPYKERKDSWENKLSAFSDLNGKLDELQSACRAIDTPSELRSCSASVSDESILEASASADATPGSYQVEINQLANAEVEMHSGLNAAETLVNNSGAEQTFTYSYGDDTVSVSVPDGTTLSGLRDLINNDSDNPGVTASILDDGGAGNTSQHLRLRGDDTGTSYGITVDGGNTDVAGDWGNLTGDSASGATSVTLDDASAFHQYQAIIVDDGNSGAEYHLVESINTDTLTFRTALGDDFTVSEGAYTTPRGLGSKASEASTAGSNEISVSDTSYFQEGQSVVVADGSNSEQLTISSVDATNNVLTFESSLSNGYAADAYVTQLEGGRHFDFDPGEFTEVQAAQNAQLRVDGYPSSGWIERETNSADGVIDGVTLDLQKTTSGSPVSVTVSQDRAAVKRKIQNFVKAYNGIKTFINKSTSYDTETDESGMLMGNYAATLVESRLREAAISAPPGFQADSDTYSLLGQVGIESVGQSENDVELGTLEVDESALDEALNEDFDAVIDLFTADFSGDSDSDYITFSDCSETLTTPGTYDVQVDFDAGGNVTEARIKLASEDTYREARIDGQQVIGKTGNPEEALWIQADWDGSSATQTAQVHVKQGIAGDLGGLVDEMQDPADGLVTTATKSYEDVVSDIESKIERQEASVARMKERLTRKYARLERMLADLQGMQSWTSGLSQSLSEE